jgi:threonine 3-dehydrogenase
MKMKALFKETPQKGAAVKEVEIPAIRDNEVLVKVKRAAICGTDIHIYFWSAFAQQRLKLPMIFGHEFCGEVVEVGRTVKRVKKGDIVAAETHIPCEVCFQCNTGLMHVCKDMKIIGVHSTGAFSEYTALPEICAWRISPALSPDVGAVYEPFGIGVHALTRHKVAGKRVLVAGAGPIGQFAVAVARLSGAMTIFSTDVSDDRLAMATRMGADVVLNPRRQDVVAEIMRRTDGFGIDIFVELSGNEQACQTGLKALRRGGAVSLVGLFNDPVTLDLVNDVIYKEATVYGITGRTMFGSWAEASDILDSGKIDISPVITHHYPLEKFDEAFETAASGKAGKIIFDIG